MNKIYKVIWNVGLQCWVAVSELTCSHGKVKSACRRAKRVGLATSGVLGGMLLLSAAQASTLTWSPSGVSSGGDGIWDITSSTWYNGTILVPWNNMAYDNALFGGLGGTVTIDSGGISVQDLQFNTDGYLLTGGVLTISSSLSLVSLTSGITATIDSVITGNGILSITGNGTLTVNGNNTYSGGTRISGGSILSVSDDSNLGQSDGVLAFGDATTSGILDLTGTFTSGRNVTLNLGGGIINIAPGLTATFNGNIYGDGGVSFSGTGSTVTLNGTNNYAGLLTVNTGVLLNVGSGGTTGTLGTGDTVNNGVLVFNRSNTGTYTGAMSGAGSVQQIGSGTTILTGNNTWTGGTTISAGTLQIGNNGSAGWMTGNITNNGTLNFFRNDTNTFAGVISGSGQVINSAGTLTLSGINTYSGGTRLQGGTLIATSDASLGDVSGGITFANTANLYGDFTTSRNVTLNGGVGYMGGVSTALTLTGVVSGAGELGVSHGTLILAGTNNTYSGDTYLGPGTVMQIAGAGSLGNTSRLRFAGGGTGVLRVMSDATINAQLYMNSSGYVSAGIDAYNGSVVTINGQIVGSSAGIYFYGGGSGGGSVILNGNNSFSGSAILSTGSRVVVSQDSNLGASTIQFYNGTLATTSTFSSNRALYFNAAGTIDVADGTTLTFNGISSGAGAFTKVNTGVLVLTGDSTRTGTTIISDGTLLLGDGGTSNSLGSGKVTNNAALAFNRSDSMSYANIISGTGDLVQSGSGTTILSGNNSYKGTTTVSSGSLYVTGNQSAATGLTTVASGASLGGTGTLGGSVTIADGGILTPGTSASPGTLTINGSLTLGTGSILNYHLGQSGTVGGLLNDLTIVKGDLTLGGTLNVDVPAGGTFDAGVYRIISYSGTLTDNGLLLGSLPSGANALLQTSVAGQINLINSYTGATFWDGAANHDNSLINGGAGIWNTGAGANSNWANADGSVNGVYSTGFAVFQGVPGLVTVDNSLGGVGVTGMQFMTDGYRINGDTISLSETLTGSGYSIIRVGDGTAAGSGYTTTIDAVLDGSVGLSKTDLGTLILTGANTYTGGTVISGGILQLGDGTTNGSVLGDIDDGSMLALRPASGTTMVLSGAISGSGALSVVGDGTVVLTGNNTYSGKTHILSGTLQIGDGMTSGIQVDPGNILNNGALVFMPASGTQFLFGDIISGTGSVAFSGPGSTVFTGTNTYTGGTTISAGSLLQLGDGTQNHDGSVVGNIANDGTLAFGYYGSKTYAGVISGNGSVLMQSGTLSLTGTNTYSGGTTLNGGNLIIADGNNLGDVSGVLTFDGGLLTGQGSGQVGVANNIVVNSGNALVNNLSLSGQISGDGYLRVYKGPVSITGSNNTWTGGTRLSNFGTLIVGTGSSLGTGTIVSECYTSCSSNYLSGGGTLQVISDLTLANAIFVDYPGLYANSGGPSLTIDTLPGATLTQQGDMTVTYGLAKKGSGTLILDNLNASGSGGFSINDGVVQVGAGDARGNLGNINVSLAASTFLNFNRVDTYSYAGIISGAGTLQQISSGTTVLNGNNTYTGGTVIVSVK